MRRVLVLLLAALLGAFGTDAIASNFTDGFYAGASMGDSDNLTVCDDLGKPASPSKCEDSDFGWQVFAGWQIMKWISIEGGWTDLGEVTYTDVTGTTSNIKTSGFQLNAVATVPVLEKAGLYFKAGAFAWDVDFTQTTPLGASSSDSESDVDYVFGVGLRYPMTESIGINLEWQRFEDIGKSQADSMSINLWTAGLLFRF